MMGLPGKIAGNRHFMLFGGNITNEVWSYEFVNKLILLAGASENK